MSSADPIKLTIRLAVATGEVTVDFSVTRGPTRLSALVPFVQHLTDIMVREAVAHQKQQGRALTCAAGCGVCCQQLVPISAPEAFLLTDYVVALEAGQRQQVLARFDRIIESIEQADAMPTLLEKVRDPKGIDLRKFSQQYRSLGLPCPLLVDSSCSAYGVRPLACRHYNVTSPAEWCTNPFEHPVETVPMPPCMAPMLANLTGKLIGGRCELVPLGYGLQWAEQHAELAFERWPGVELIRMFLAELGIDEPAESAGSK